METTTTLSAIESTLPGKREYCAVLTFEQVADLLSIQDMQGEVRSWAQRPFDEKWAAKLARVVRDNADYFFPPLIVALQSAKSALIKTPESIGYTFTPNQGVSPESPIKHGILELPHDAVKLRIRDGQHRVGAIKMLVESDPEIYANYLIGVTIYTWRGLDTEQMRFGAINSGKAVPVVLRSAIDLQSESTQFAHTMLSRCLTLDKLVNKTRNPSRTSDQFFSFKDFATLVSKFIKGLPSDNFSRQQINTMLEAVAQALMDAYPEWAVIEQANSEKADRLTAGEDPNSYVDGSVYKSTRIIGADLIKAIGSVLANYAKTYMELSPDDNPERFAEEIAKLKLYLSGLKHSTLNLERTNPVWAECGFLQGSTLGKHSGGMSRLVNFLIARLDELFFDVQESNRQQEPVQEPEQEPEPELVA